MTRFIGVVRIFDWGGGARPNHKSHYDVSKIFRKDKLLGGQRYRRMEDQKRGPGLACNLGFAQEKRLEPKIEKISKLSDSNNEFFIAGNIAN